jgi:phasin family protein
MNMNETFVLMNQSSSDYYANLNKLAEINMNAWQQLVAGKMAVMNHFFETAGKQAELLKDAKRVDELVEKQAELARDLGEQILESNKEVVEILSNTRDEYQEIAEASAVQAKSQLNEVAEVVKHAQAA